MWHSRKDKYIDQTTTTSYTVTALSSSACGYEGSTGLAADGPSSKDGAVALHPSAIDLRDTNSLDLYRVSSMDGRAEGWLVLGSVDAAEMTDLGGAPTEVWTPSPPQAALLMERLRMDPRDILVPDRIWDGTCREIKGNKEEV
jgi:hypothetical protein